MTLFIPNYYVVYYLKKAFNCIKIFRI